MSNCKSNSTYKSPYNGDIVACIIRGPHVVHTDKIDGSGYFWEDKMASDKPANVFPESARDRQVGGDHYKGSTMQPFDVIDAFGLDYYEGSALKYLLRWRKKNGVEDLEKAKHYIEILIEKATNGV